MSIINNTRTGWHPFKGGSTIGKIETEDGIIIRDEEFNDDARITLGRDGDVAPFAITMGIYGWTFYTCFFEKESDAQETFDRMKPDIESIVKLLPQNEDQFEKKKYIVGDAIGKFVNKY